jgi:serine/threonine-protein kinase RsbW
VPEKTLPGGEVCFGRAAELNLFQRRVRELGREWGRSIFLWGPPGSGKTTLLKAVVTALQEAEGDVLPFYYSMPKLKWSFDDFAADFTEAFAAQYLAFRQGTPVLAAERAGIEERLRADGTAGGSFLASEYRRRCEEGSGRSPAYETASLPLRFAAAAGWKVLTVIDDFPHVKGYEPAALMGWPEGALRSPRAPMILTGRSRGQVAGVLGRDGMAGLLEMVELPSLPAEEAVVMLRSLLRVGGVEMTDTLVSEAARLAGGEPHALAAVARSLAGEGKIDGSLLYRTYAESVCQGDIYDYWMDILAGSFGELAGRRTALEVLVHCVREEDSPPTVERLPTSMLKSREAVEEALTGLVDAGLITADCSRVRLARSATLKDFVMGLYRHETGGGEWGFVSAALAAEKLRAAGEERNRQERERSRERIRSLLEGWEGQQVPKGLFQGGGIPERADVSDEELLTRLGEEGEVLRLPRIVSSASGHLMPESGPPGVEADAAAWGLQERAGGGDKSVCWLVRLQRGETGERDIAEFQREAGALESAGALGDAGVVGWMISAAGFSSEALAKARRERMLTSTVRQVTLLAKCLGRDVGEILAPAGATVGKGRRLDFEMTIPMVSETELVAARAVEQMAESMDFDASETGRIKMALVEACINAFEHSGLEEGKVRLSFTIEGRSLMIRVENRGRKFAPQRIVGAGAKTEMSKRGWGLNLIRELMDEVEFERVDDGVRLVMVKHLKGKEGNGEQVPDDDGNAS